jgi:hypothetical protein
MSFSSDRRLRMYKKNYQGNVSKAKGARTISPLYDAIEIMGDHLVRVYEHREKASEQRWCVKQPCQDRLIVEAIAGFFMTGTFPFRCPIEELKKIST